MRKTSYTVALAASLALTPAIAAVPEDGDILFEVFRDGDSDLGRHTLRFEQRGEELHVFIDIELEAKFGFITVFEYSHSNHEVWVDDTLVSIETKTNNDGEQLFVNGKTVDGGFEVTTRDGTELLPADIVPTSYWNARTLEGGELLNTQTGELVEVNLSKRGMDTLEIGGRQIDAQRYRMYGDLDLDLWYAADNEWVKIAFEIAGTQVNYERNDSVEIQEAQR